MRVLFITNQNFLGKVNFGGAQCSKRNYEIIKAVWGDENIKYLIFTDETIGNSHCSNGIILKISKNNVSKYLNLLFWRDCFSARTKKGIKQYIKEVNPDIVFMDGSSFGFVGKFCSTNTMRIVFYHNIQRSYAWSRVKNTSPLCIIKFLSFWLNERFITKTADICICLNKRDENLLVDYYGRKADFILPVTFEDVGEEHIFMNRKQKDTLLFVGSYFMPNIKGITWFCKSVMPFINKKLIIVGKQMELLKEKLETKNVHVIGTVDCLEDYYQKADGIVMPIFIGDGMKVKTAEAMMYGKPIFATDEALEGYEVEGTAGIYRCNTAEDFITHINKQKVFGYCDDVRKLFLNEYCSETIVEKFSNFIQNNKRKYKKE